MYLGNFRIELREDCENPHYVVIAKNKNIKGRKLLHSRFGAAFEELHFKKVFSYQYHRPLVIDGERRPLDLKTLMEEKKPEKVSKARSHLFD